MVFESDFRLKEPYLYTFFLPVSGSLLGLFLALQTGHLIFKSVNSKHNYVKLNLNINYITLKSNIFFNNLVGQLINFFSLFNYNLK